MLHCKGNVEYSTVHWLRNLSVLRLCVRLLGAGGYGKVYQVKHRKLGYRAVVKLFALDDNMVREKSFLQRLAALSDEFGPVLPLLACSSPDTCAYIAMPSFGKSLALWLHHQGAMDEAACWSLTKQLAAGLLNIHKAGVLHLDVKPGNIIKSTRSSKHGLSKIQYARVSDARRMHMYRPWRPISASSVQYTVIYSSQCALDFIYGGTRHGS